MKQAVFLVGEPGCGKGTQLKALLMKAAELDMSCFGFGMSNYLNQFALAAAGEGYADQILPVMARGDLVADEITLMAFKWGLNNAGMTPKDEEVYFFDGVPRNLLQAQQVRNTDLPRFGIIDFLTIHLGCPPNVAADRLKNKPPRVDSQTGKPRADDDPKIVAYREEIAARELPPLLDYLRRSTQFETVDGGQPEELVTARILSILGWTHAAANV